MDKQLSEKENCPSDFELTDFINRTLPPEIQERIRVHAEQCDACRSLIGQLFVTGTSVALNTSLQSIPHATPEKIDRYHILRPLGSGAMGIVYSAFDSQLGRTVALKLLRSPDQSTNRERLRREAQTLAQLTHPNIVTVYEVGQWQKLDFVCMEFVNGPNLYEWLREKKRSLPEIVATFREAGQGLAAAHRAGFLHRDFKPSNVFIGHDGRVRVGDFGLARFLNAPITLEVPLKRGPLDLTQTGMVLGTPAYMSPEQHLAQPADARSDQFSFCVALYEAIWNQRPFQGATSLELLSYIHSDRLTIPAFPSVPWRWRRAIRKGLRARPSDRHASMEALLHELKPPTKRDHWMFAITGTGGCALGIVIAFTLTCILCCGLISLAMSDIDPEVIDALEAHAEQQCPQDPKLYDLKLLFEKIRYESQTVYIPQGKWATFEGQVNRVIEDGQISPEEMKKVEDAYAVLIVK